MRMLDVEMQRSLRNVGLYLAVQEAEELRDELDKLLEDPDANEHFHVCDRESSREISCSIITSAKLKNSQHYTEAERQLFLEE